MSINNAHCNDGISIYADERILLRKTGVHIKFKGEGLPDSMKKDVGGSMFLTQFRMIFLSEKSKGPLKSFSFPFHSVRDLDIKQPLFGANYITALVLAEIDGGFQGSAKFDITFNDGGAIEFAKALFRTAKECQARPRWVPTGPPSYFDIFGPVGGMGYPGPGYPVPGYEQSSSSAAPPAYPNGAAGTSAAPPEYGFTVPNAAGSSFAPPPPAYYSADNPNSAMVPNGASGGSSLPYPTSSGAAPSAPPPSYDAPGQPKKDD